MKYRFVVAVVCLGLVGLLFGLDDTTVPVSAQSGSSGGFGDVGGVHAPGVEALADAGLFGGTLCDGGFCPGEYVERWVMAVRVVPGS